MKNKYYADAYGVDMDALLACIRKGFELANSDDEIKRVVLYSYTKNNFMQISQIFGAEKVNQMLNENSWIIDGNFLNNATERFKECDCVFFLDINRFVCLRSVIKRHKQYKGKHRDSRSDFCDEKLTRAYLKWVFTDFYKTSRKFILNYIKEKIPEDDKED